MLVAINELSFSDSCKNDHEAVKALKDLADLLQSESYTKFSGNNQVYIKSCLKDMLMTEDKTLHSHIFDMYKQHKTDLPEYAGILMHSLVNVSRVIPEGEINQDVKYNGIVIKNSSLNFSFQGKIHFATLSLVGSKEFSENRIEVDINGNKHTTINITTLDSLSKCVWHEKPNIMKHGKEDNMKRRKKASRMDLEGDAAQYALSNSVKLLGNAGSFYFNGNQWYKFNFENENTAHGFCEDNPHKQNNIHLAKRVYEELGERRIGQIFIEYTKLL
ncbi:hypothetical protein ACEH94_000619 [Vibrio alginolyticus]